MQKKQQNSFIRPSDVKKNRGEPNWCKLALSTNSQSLPDLTRPDRDHSDDDDLPTPLIRSRYRFPSVGELISKYDPSSNASSWRQQRRKVSHSKDVDDFASASAAGRSSKNKRGSKEECLGSSSSDRMTPLTQEEEEEKEKGKQTTLFQRKRKSKCFKEYEEDGCSSSSSTNNVASRFTSLAAPEEAGADPTEKGNTRQEPGGSHARREGEEKRRDSEARNAVQEFSSRLKWSRDRQKDPESRSSSEEEENEKKKQETRRLTQLPSRAEKLSVVTAFTKRERKNFEGKEEEERQTKTNSLLLSGDKNPSLLPQKRIFEDYISTRGSSYANLSVSHKRESVLPSVVDKSLCKSVPNLLAGLTGGAKEKGGGGGEKENYHYNVDGISGSHVKRVSQRLFQRSQSSINFRSSIRIMVRPETGGGGGTATATAPVALRSSSEERNGHSSGGGGGGGNNGVLELNGQKVRKDSIGVMHRSVVKEQFR